MSANFSDLPPRYLRTPEASRFVGLSIRTLEKHRIYGTGPRYSKLGGRVVYRVDELQAWVESGARAHTSDSAARTVPPAARQSPLVPPMAATRGRR
ncbi:helix-turn-helix transcriptional regulator [Acidomonas methanolica]|uniref:helix-turn-helix transcriptional regulator n=1 Tax=Acidomonas methanolica TaxID=437 RepID=UPI002119D6B7|nr:helix-turn-helix domain-containing protein [Acidomonas methanolica]MCQ9156819.1 helix-turn-helix domain-containing protein [Acidomonas methanolica]